MDTHEVEIGSLCNRQCVPSFAGFEMLAHEVLCLFLSIHLLYQSAVFDWLLQYIY